MTAEAGGFGYSHLTVLQLPSDLESGGDVVIVLETAAGLGHPTWPLPSRGVAVFWPAGVLIDVRVAANELVIASGRGRQLTGSIQLSGHFRCQLEGLVTTVFLFEGMVQSTRSYQLV